MGINLHIYIVAELEKARAEKDVELERLEGLVTKHKAEVQNLQGKNSFQGCRLHLGRVDPYFPSAALIKTSEGYVVSVAKWRTYAKQMKYLLQIMPDGCKVCMFRTVSGSCMQG